MIGWALCFSAVEAREISGKRECSICHIMWLDEFNKANAETLIPYDPKPVVPTGKQDVVSTERMCFSCHDGFVRDSRFAWAKREHFHPVGVKPPPNIKLPSVNGKKLFPLNEEGKMYCGTCHSAHGVDWSEQVSPLFLRVKNLDSSICLACHLERSTGPKEGNHPVFKKQKAPTPALDEAGSKFGQGRAVVCQSCHRVHGAATDKLLVVENDKSQLCGNCHDDKRALGREEAASKSTHPVNVIPDKVVVPAELEKTHGSKRGPEGEVICQTCHKPHNAVRGKRILVKENSGSKFCTTCHQTESSVVGTKHDVGKSQEKTALEDGSGPCASCHKPHNGSGPKMWARVPGNSSDPISANCLSCHQENGLAKNKLVGQHSHPVGRALDLLGKNVELPGFTQHGSRHVNDGKGSVGCPSCHNPHQWDPSNAANKGRDIKDGDERTSFLRLANDSDAALCIKCHDDKHDLAGTPHDRSAMKKMASVKMEGLPKQGGLCSTCHLPHNGKGVRMWAMTPYKEAVDPVAALCQSCHNAAGAASEKLTGEHTHPIGVPIAKIGIDAQAGGWFPQLRNVFDKVLRRLPLFDDAGTRVETGGKVSCPSCHNLHRPTAGKNAPADAFLRIANGTGSELCRNCHLDKGSISVSKHALAKTAPDFKNVAGDAARNAGLCAACHLPHNGKGARMWAGPNGPGSDVIARACQGCHQDGGVASKKRTGNYSHPLGKKPAGMDQPLPLFTEDGKRDPEGSVTCATCHNLHQWNAGSILDNSGADSGIEGDAKNSFLRLPAAPDGALCMNCHTDKKWVAATDHDMRVTVPEARNQQGKLVEQSGICGQCHEVHNAPSEVRLWARTPGPGADAMETLCTSCHAPESIAHAKIPANLRHPPEVRAVSLTLPDPERKGGYFPLFTKEGAVSRSGVISCPSCHNPHRWRSGIDETGPGINAEGDARSSFLRNRSDTGICANCHGLDSLFRYKYFHTGSSRVPHPLYR